MEMGLDTLEELKKHPPTKKKITIISVIVQYPVVYFLIIRYLSACFTKPYLFQNHQSPIPPLLLFFKVVKNLLFVAKVLYLLHPDSWDKQGEIKDGVEDQEALGDGVARADVEEHEACAREAAASDREGNGEQAEPGRPATLLGLIRKLSRIAKLEAAYSPRNPLKVRMMCSDGKESLF